MSHPTDRGVRRAQKRCKKAARLELLPQVVTAILAAKANIDEGKGLHEKGPAWQAFKARFMRAAVCRRLSTLDTDEAAEAGLHLGNGKPPTKGWWD